MEALLGIFVGVGLAAACGFRVFVPLFVASVAGHINPEMVPFGAGFEWLSSWPAMIALGTATLLEIGAYYLPWVDNALDAVASPAAVVAGTLATAAFLPEGMGPFLSWSAAAIVGGGSAGVVQTASVLTRGASTGTTGGLANPLVSTAELAGAGTLAVLAIVLPILAAILVFALVFWAIRLLIRVLRRRNQKIYGTVTETAAAEEPLPPR